MGSTSYVKEVKALATPAYALSKAALNMAVMKYALKLKDEGFTQQKRYNMIERGD